MTPTTESAKTMERNRAVAVLCAYTGRCVADLAEEEIGLMRNALDAVLNRARSESAPAPIALKGISGLIEKWRSSSNHIFRIAADELEAANKAPADHWDGGDAGRMYERAQIAERCVSALETAIATHAPPGAGVGDAQMLWFGRVADRVSAILAEDGWDSGGDREEWRSDVENAVTVALLAHPTPSPSAERAPVAGAWDLYDTVYSAIESFVGDSDWGVADMAHVICRAIKAAPPPDAGTAAPVGVTEDIEDRLFKAIEHGDNEHRLWLRGKLREFFADITSRAPGST
jgi:hypothetical protein